MDILEKILIKRGLTGDARTAFLNPRYESAHDPFLLPDMQAAVDRLGEARRKQEHIMIYGDYDIDGLTATTVLLDALKSFGFRYVDAFIPNRFIEGYGMTDAAVEAIAESGATLIITVDCGSLSEGPITRAKELGVDVIVTDHHNVASVQPPAVAVINPKRLLQDYPESYERFILKDDAPQKGIYPFLDLPGVGVAFKLVQALQTKLDGLDAGQEKWLLDLVALGTVCDIVTLVDENRTHVYWGLKVLAKTRRQGLRALMAVSGVEAEKINARALGFGLGPRMNAAGRLETAKYSQDMLLATREDIALELAQKLDEMNTERRRQQDEIFKAAIEQAEVMADDRVLVLSHPDWSHGIIGIVAAKILEKYKKPTYVLQEIGDESKGSARSFGDFSVADAIRASDDIITKGGGHKLAAGVTLPTANIAAFRQRVNEFYDSCGLTNQTDLLLPTEDIAVDSFEGVNEQLIAELATLEPYGSANPEPIICFRHMLVARVRTMGAESQHIKLDLQDAHNRHIEMIGFSVPQEWFVGVGQYVTVWAQLSVNEWKGRRSVEGRILHLTSH